MTCRNLDHDDLYYRSYGDKRNATMQHSVFDMSGELAVERLNRLNFVNALLMECTTSPSSVASLRGSTLLPPQDAEIREDICRLKNKKMEQFLGEFDSRFPPPNPIHK